MNTKSDAQLSLMEEVSHESHVESGQKKRRPRVKTGKNPRHYVQARTHATRLLKEGRSYGEIADILATELNYVSYKTGQALTPSGVSQLIKYHSIGSIGLTKMRSTVEKTVHVAVAAPPAPKPLVSNPDAGRLGVIQQIMSLNIDEQTKLKMIALASGEKT